MKSAARKLERDEWEEDRRSRGFPMFGVGDHAYVIFDSTGPLYVGKGSNFRFEDSMSRIEETKDWLRKQEFDHQPTVFEPVCAAVACINADDVGGWNSHRCDYHMEQTAFDLEASLIKHYDLDKLANVAKSPGLAVQGSEDWRKYRAWYPVELLKKLVAMTTDEVAKQLPSCLGTHVGQVHYHTSGIIPSGRVFLVNHQERR